jgi:hypothetical protein
MSRNSQLADINEIANRLSQYCQSTRSDLPSKLINELESRAPTLCLDAAPDVACLSDLPTTHARAGVKQMIDANQNRLAEVVRQNYASTLKNLVSLQGMGGMQDDKMLDLVAAGFANEYRRQITRMQEVITRQIEQAKAAGSGNCMQKRSGFPTVSLLHAQKTAPLAESPESYTSPRASIHQESTPQQRRDPLPCKAHRYHSCTGMSPSYTFIQFIRDTVQFSRYLCPHCTCALLVYIQLIAHRKLI